MHIWEKHPGNQVYLNVDYGGKIDSASWTYAKLLQYYATYGGVPGISVDFRAMSSRFGLPLLTTICWSNDGHILIFGTRLVS